MCLEHSCVLILHIRQLLLLQGCCLEGLVQVLAWTLVGNVDILYVPSLEFTTSDLNEVVSITLQVIGSLFQGRWLTTVHLSGKVAHNCSSFREGGSQLFIFQGRWLTTVHLSGKVAHNCSSFREGGSQLFIFQERWLTTVHL